VEVGPTAATAFFPKYADPLSQLDALAWLDGRVDGFQVRVAAVPAVPVEDVDVVVVAARLVERSIAVLGHGLATRRDDQPIAGRYHLDHSLAAANVVAGVVIDRPARRETVAAVNVGRLVAHLRRAGEPALLGGIDEGAGSHPGRACRPEAEAGVLIQAPRVLERVAVAVVAARHRAIDLYAPDRHRQPIVAGRQRRRGAVDLDRHARQPNGRAHRVAGFFKLKQLDPGLRTVRKLDVLAFAAVEIDGTEQRLARDRLIAGPGHEREGGKEGEHEMHLPFPSTQAR
jgi:hypothetical protein